MKSGHSLTHMSNSTWQKSLPSLTYPAKSDSLYSYILKLDYLNNFSAGTVLDMVKLHNTGRLSLNRPGLFLVGTIFDFERISALTNIPVPQIYDLTFVPVIKRLFRIEVVYPKLVGYSSHFKICPRCIKDKKLPLIHNFNNIKICYIHKLLLHDKCVCGNRIMLFTLNTNYYHCPYCLNPYETLSEKPIHANEHLYKEQFFYYSAYHDLIYKKKTLIKEYENIAEGFENRLQYIKNKKGISDSHFKKIFGIDIALMKNGHGLNNLSLSKLIEMLYALDCSVDEFCNLQFPYNAQKILTVHSQNNGHGYISKCPNIHCEFYTQINQGNIKHYGRKTLKSCEIVIEEYCNKCGTRFIGNNITQSYDYNPGLRQYDIDKARNRITLWQEKLRVVCNEMIKKRIPITLTETFKQSGIPIGKSYFSERLGLISILLEYSNKQREDFNQWGNELCPKEREDFLRRIYKKKVANKIN